MRERAVDMGQHSRCHGDSGRSECPDVLTELSDARDPQCLTFEVTREPVIPKKIERWRAACRLQKARRWR